VSTSATATANGVTLTVTADPALARLAIDLRGGPAGDPVYVLRRDKNGTTIVRPFSAGTLLWQSGTPTTVPTVFEYEARQGLETDFIVTDLDGSPVVSLRFVVPTWGTWLKHPGKPFLNLMCIWHEDSDYLRSVERTVLRIRGAKHPLTLSDRRTSPAGQIKLKTTTSADARSFSALVGDGQVLMVDVPDDFGVPVRYVSVGSVSGERVSVGALIDEQARIWTLDVVEVAAPIGLPAGQGFTYEGLSALADSYIGLAAIFASYEDLAVGMET
jgi:hypothetical protein